MTAESKTSVAAHFVAYNFPSAADFGNLIDSYTDASDALEAVATAARTGSKGLVYVSGASAVTLYSATPTGLRIANAATTAAAVGLLGAGAVGSAIFFASTTAAAQQQLGGGTVGRQIYSAVSTADIISLAGVPVAATQAQMEAVTSSDVMGTPLNLRFHPGVAKAYAVFDTAGSAAGSYNVDSITDKGTGEWTVNFTNPMSTVGYSPIVTLGGSAGSRLLAERFSALAVSSFTVKTFKSSDGTSDETSLQKISVVVFGDM